ncbi:MAG: hypothetical protein ACRCVT_07980 [Leadbetterella sp.]
MLEYIKLILEKVSFDKKLFRKELLKGISRLAKSDIKELRSWCYDRFGTSYMTVLNEVFRSGNLSVG